MHGVGTNAIRRIPGQSRHASTAIYMKGCRGFTLLKNFNGVDDTLGPKSLRHGIGSLANSISN